MRWSNVKVPRKKGCACDGHIGIIDQCGFVVCMQQRVRPASRQTIILLHGYGSSARATTALATAIQTQTHLKRRQQVNVSP